MANRKTQVIIIALLLTAIAIHWFSGNQQWVDKYFAFGLYPLISLFLRTLLGWLHFSFGDLLYGLAVVVLAYKLARFVKQAFKRQLTAALALSLIQRVCITLLAVYISFNLLWGINYNRTGIAAQTGISLKNYTVDDLLIIDSLLLLKVNDSKRRLENNASGTATTAEMSVKTINAFRRAELKYPFLHPEPVSLKPSMWGWLGNYLGFNGYYNPFTGEAQVNTTVPVFIQPFIFCHETAHQLGYAKENEANFVGYLAAKESADPSFHYSAYLDLFLYAHRNLYIGDSVAARALSKQISPAVTADLTALKKFNSLHQSPLEPVISWIYGKYLKNNQQPSGNQSYDEVVGLLIAYYKKNGSI